MKLGAQFKIVGRGIVQEITLERDEKAPKIGDKIVVNGKSYIITGIESIGRSSPHRGLQIRETK